jgi:hypothetical protein
MPMAFSRRNVSQIRSSSDPAVGAAHIVHTFAPRGTVHVHFKTKK